MSNKTYCADEEKRDTVKNSYLYEWNKLLTISMHDIN